MRKLILLTVCLLIYESVYAQECTITLRNLDVTMASVSALSGEKTHFVDSIKATGKGIFSFQLPPEKPRGLYRITIDRRTSLDVINDGEDVEITSDAKALTDSLKVNRSESNRLYYAFRRLNQQYKSKSEILQFVLARYPHDDPYYAISVNTATEIQKQYSEFIRAATISRPSSFVARYIHSAQLPVTDLTQPPDRQLSFLKCHALDNIDFTDEGLIHSDLFASKSIEYLMYYRNPQLPKDLLAKEFNSAVDSILSRAKVNPVVYKHITGYLVDGFKQFGFEECINYILDNYVIKDDLCLDGTGNAIHNMIDQKKRFPVGASVPEIILPDTSDQAVSLHGLKGERTLLLFYSSQCPHCRSMIPRLASRYPNKFPILAVSLDTSRTEWVRFIRENQLPWINVYDPGGWNGKTAKEYSLYATPTMVLVDKEKKVIGRPITLEELEQLVK
jgi:peroxiredoxin